LDNLKEIFSDTLQTISWNIAVKKSAPIFAISKICSEYIIFHLEKKLKYFSERIDG
jgi:hypothetical protein